MKWIESRTEEAPLGGFTGVNVVYSMWVTSCSPRGLFLNSNQKDWQTPSISLPPPPTGRRPRSLHPWERLVCVSVSAPASDERCPDFTRHLTVWILLVVCVCTLTQCRGRLSTRPGTGGRAGTLTSSTTSCGRARSWARPWRACHAVSWPCLGAAVATSPFLYPRITTDFTHFHGQRPFCKTSVWVQSGNWLVCINRQYCWEVIRRLMTGYFFKERNRITFLT